MLHLVIPDDDGRVAGRQRVGEVPGRRAGRRRIDGQAQPVEGVVGRIGHEAHADAGLARKPRVPELEMARLEGADPLVVPLLPRLEGRDRPDDALLADLHAPADAGVLEERGPHEVLPARHDARGRTPEELVGAVDGQVRAGGQEAPEIVLRRQIGDDRDAARVADLRESRQRELAVLDRVVRHHVEGGRRALGEPVRELVVAHVGRLADRHDPGAREAHGLLHGRAVADHVPGLDDDLVPHAGRVRQLLDAAEIDARSCSRPRRS